VKEVDIVYERGYKMEEKSSIKFGFPTEIKYFEDGKPRITPYFGFESGKWKTFASVNEAVAALIKQFPNETKEYAQRLREDEIRDKEKKVTREESGLCVVRLSIPEEPFAKKASTKKVKSSGTVKEKVAAYYDSLPAGEKGSYDHYCTTTDNPVCKGTFNAQTSFRRKAMKGK
jgi:hypothetical protein